MVEVGKTYKKIKDDTDIKYVSVFYKSSEGVYEALINDSSNIVVMNEEELKDYKLDIQDESTFTLCTEKLSEENKLVTLILFSGEQYDVCRTESSFDPKNGYVYEGIDTRDYYQKDVKAWKYR